MLTDMSRADPQPGRSLRVSTDLVIETPENVVLTYRLAGPAARLLAYLVDFLLRVALLFAIHRSCTNCSAISPASFRICRGVPGRILLWSGTTTRA